jgi:hypothetical protein
MSETKASNRDGNIAVEKKYIGNRISDGPVSLPDDDVANHEEFWKRRFEDSSRQSVEAGLRNLPEHSLRNLAIRQRNRLAGSHERPAVGQESREVTLDHVSRLSAARLWVAGMFPKLNRASALFNEAVAYSLMNEDEQAAYETRHPERF